jgi:hypothetical protein
MEPYLEADRPLLERIGAKNVNAILLWIYTGFWGWGLACFFLIPIHANEPWPLALALAFVLTAGFIRALEIGIGATLVPNYVYYPVLPRWPYMLQDSVFLVCWIAILASYIVSSASSTVPLFTVFFMDLALPVLLFKLYRLVFPDGFLAGAKSDAPPAGDAALQFPGGEEYYDEYVYGDFVEGSAAAPARKLAMMLRADRQARAGVKGRPFKK